MVVKNLFISCQLIFTIMARILNISDVRLYPVRTGSQNTTYQLCRYLAAKNHDIIVLNICHPGNKKEKTSRKEDWIHAFYNIRSPLAKRPFGIVFRILRNFYLHFVGITVKQPFVLMKSEIKEIEYILQKERIDAIIVQRAHLGRYIESVGGENVFKVLQAHDLQYLRDYKFQSYRGRDISRKLNRFITAEVDIINKFDKVIDIAEYEANELVKNGVSKSKLYSNGTPVSYVNYCPYDRHAKYDLVFVGGDLFQNLVSLEWFLATIWNQIKSNGYTFVIAGGVSNRINTKAYGTGLVLLGEFDNIQKIYQKSRLVVAPLMVGSGVKVKVVEALMNSKVVLTNNFGIQGIPIENGKEYIHCEEPQQWIDEITSTIVNEERMEMVGRNAWRWASQHATVENVYGTFEREIESKFKTDC